MRNLIDICEAVRRSPEGFKSGPFERFYREVLQDGGDMFDAEPNDLPKDAVREWIKTHRALFRKGWVTVYRTMQLDPEFVIHLRPGTELGNHWTYEFNSHVLEQFDIRFETGAKPIYVFEATVRTGEVAFPLTVAYNVFFPNECEIFLDSRYARPKLVSIRQLDTKMFEVEDENLRPDLVGAEMAA